MRAARHARRGPPRAGPKPYASPRHRVDLGHLDGQEPGVPESCRCHQGAEPDRVGIAGQPCQRGPRVRGPGQAIAVAHDEQVVRAEERREAALLRLPCGGELGGIRRPLLGLDEHAQLYGGHSK